MKFILLNEIDFQNSNITAYGHIFAISIDGLVLVESFEVQNIKCSKLLFNDGREFICIQTIREVLERINEVSKWLNQQNIYSHYHKL